MAKLADIRILRGTVGQLNTYGNLNAGEQFLSTDTGEVFVGTGTSNILVGRAMVGLLASRPTAGVSGRFYHATDSAITYVDNGTAWKQAGAVTLDDLSDGTTYGRVRLSELEDGQVTRLNDGTDTVTIAEVKGKADKVVPTEVGSLASLDALGNLVDSQYKLNDLGTTSADLWSAQKIGSHVNDRLDGLSWKQVARVATTANIVLEAEQTIDTIAVVAGDRVVVKDQTDATQNGIYVVVAGGAWTRATDTDTQAELKGATVRVHEGDQAGSVWTQTTVNVVIGTDDIVWAQKEGPGGLQAGIGIAIDGSQISVRMGAGITQLPDGKIGIDIDATGGLTVDPETQHAQLGIKTDVTTGATVAPLNLSANGAGVKVDNSTITHTSGELAVPAGGITSTEINASVVSDGLQGGAGTAISVKSDATGGANLAKVVNVTANGVAVRIDNVTVKENGSNQLYVASIDGGEL